MILTERFLLPPNIDDAQRQAIVHKRVHPRRGVNGRVIAVLPGEAGWIQQAMRCRSFAAAYLPRMPSSPAARVASTSSIQHGGLWCGISAIATNSHVRPIKHHKDAPAALIGRAISLAD